MNIRLEPMPGMEDEEEGDDAPGIVQGDTKVTEEVLQESSRANRPRAGGLLVVAAFRYGTEGLARAGGATRSGARRRLPRLCGGHDLHEGEPPQFLIAWRKAVVREGQRMVSPPPDAYREMSLTGTCLKCHETSATFCTRCQTMRTSSLPAGDATWCREGWWGHE